MPCHADDLFQVLTSYVLVCGARIDVRWGETFHTRDATLWDLKYYRSQSHTVIDSRVETKETTWR